MSATARAGKWLPDDKQAIKKYVREMITKAYKGDKERTSPPNPEDFFHSYILELKELIETDPEVNMLFTTMFTQDAGDPEGGSGIAENYTQMLVAMNLIMTIAPKFSDADLVGVPLNALLLYPMATPSGTMAFINDKVNKCFQKILRNWAVLLNGPNSRYVLNQQDGWLSEAALDQMPGFLETYVTDQSDPYWGFKSWNDFFARKLLPNVRPVDGPNDPCTIVAACESTPYLLRKNPQFRDTFWVKDQPYSLQHMLNNEPIAESFVGGTIYQAFLSTMNYHRWHVPVDGRIKKAYVVEGAYYAEALSMGFDPTGDTYSQSYLTNVSNRAIIIIDADSTDVGTVVFIAIGMAEIASVPIEVYEGQRVRKGDPMGTFHFGGSSYILAFQKGVNVKFILDPIPVDPPPELALVNTKIAQVVVAEPASGKGRRCPTCNK